MMAEGVLLDGWDDGGSGGMAIVSVSVRMFMLSICCGSHKPQVICRRPQCLVLPALNLAGISTSLPGGRLARWHCCG
jgi:hypothetical protein